jgi:hypothetical protein
VMFNWTNTTGHYQWHGSGGVAGPALDTAQIGAVHPVNPASRDSLTPECHSTHFRWFSRLRHMMRIESRAGQSSERAVGTAEARGDHRSSFQRSSASVLLRMCSPRLLYHPSGLHDCLPFGGKGRKVRAISPNGVGSMSEAYVITRFFMESRLSWLHSNQEARSYIRAFACGMRRNRIHSPAERPKNACPLTI